MPIEPLHLIGAGGHAAVVSDAAVLCGSAIKGVYSEDVLQVGRRFLDCTIELFDPGAISGPFHVAIGNNDARERLYGLLERQVHFATAISHPQAVIAASATVGSGSFLAAGVILAPRSRIGKGVIVNHRAVVDHDVSVGDYSHIAPGVTLGGGVRIGPSVLVGAGATVLPGIAIGAGAIIGAGAVVLVDIPAGQAVVGVPARPIARGV